MSSDAQKGYGSTLILLGLGIFAFFAGARSLVLLIPAAILVYYGTGPLLRGGRN